MPDGADVFANRHHPNISLGKASFFHFIIEAGAEVDEFLPDGATTRNAFHTDSINEPVSKNSYCYVGLVRV